MAARIAFVIDDQPAILTLIERVLRSDGWEVASFQSGSGALDALRNGAAPDVALVDLWLESDGDGAECLADLRAVRPELECIVMSGAPEAAKVAEEAGLRFIRKPFDIDELLEVMCEALPG